MTKKEKLAFIKKLEAWRVKQAKLRDELAEMLGEAEDLFENADYAYLEIEGIIETLSGLV